MIIYKTKEVYFNIETGDWCNSLGNPVMPSLIPRFTLYTKTLLIVHLVRNGGIIVEDFDKDCFYAFSVFAETTKAIIVHTPDELINKSDYQMQYPEMDPTKGRLVILVDCNTVEMQSELLTWEAKSLNVEITISTPSMITAIIKAKCYFDNSSMTTQEVNSVVFSGAVTTGTVSIPLDVSSVLVTVNTSKYDLLNAVIEAPIGSETSYSVQNVTVLTDSVQVFFNATIAETGHVLRYSLIRKA